MKKICFNTGWSCNGAPVTLPHDAQILETRGPKVSDGGHGYFPGGIYTYEKTFTAPAAWEGQKILVEFEGVYKNSTVARSCNIQSVPTLILYKNGQSVWRASGARPLSELKEVIDRFI